MALSASDLTRLTSLLQSAGINLDVDEISQDDLRTLAIASLLTSNGDAAWTTPTLTAAWQQSDPPVQYRKDGSGTVFLRGGVTFGSNVGQTIFTLPVGYRPSSANASVPVFRYLGAGGNAFNQFVLVMSTGQVLLQGTAPATGDTTVFDGVVFKAEL